MKVSLAWTKYGSNVTPSVKAEVHLNPFNFHPNDRINVVLTREDGLRSYLSMSRVGQLASFGALTRESKEPRHG